MGFPNHNSSFIKKTTGIVFLKKRKKRKRKYLNRPIEFDWKMTALSVSNFIFYQIKCI